MVKSLKRFKRPIDSNDATALLGYVSLFYGLYRWSPSLALVVCGAVLLAVSFVGVMRSGGH